MSGHSVQIIHGYGGEVNIRLDDFMLKNINFYRVEGEPGKLPQLTVTLGATSVVYDAETKAD